MSHYSERTIYETLGLRFSELEVELRSITLDFEEDLETFHRQMAKINHLQSKLSQEKQHIAIGVPDNESRRNRITSLLNKLALLTPPTPPDVVAFQQKKASIELRMNLLMKHNGRLLAQQGCLRPN
nr:hypothetical protein [uncultured Arsenicibacter sp.]